MERKRKTFTEHAEFEAANITSLFNNTESLNEFSFTADTMGRNIDVQFDRTVMTDTLFLTGDYELYGAEVKIKGCSSTSYPDFILEDGLANKMAQFKQQKGYKEIFYINVFTDCTLSWSLSYLMKNKGNIKKSTQMHTATNCSDRNTNKKPKTFYHLNPSHAKVIDFKRLDD